MNVLLVTNLHVPIILENDVTERQLIDDAFYVVKARFLWHSFDKEDKGLVSALTEEQCISGTRFYLKGKQEGFEDTKTYDGEVGGKL